MKHSTKINVIVSCICFLALIYALASLDKGHRKQADQEIATMADEDEEQPMMAPQKIMYLTFDLAPSKNTQKVLDILDKYQIKATFFVSGKDGDYLDMIKTIYNHGHALGIHSYHLSSIDANTTIDQYEKDITIMQGIIKESTGVETHLLRFPDNMNGVQIQEYTAFMKEKGFQYYDWNAYIQDLNPTLTTEQLKECALRSIKGKSNVILWMHNGASHVKTAEALEDILLALIAQGWEFRIIQE